MLDTVDTTRRSGEIIGQFGFTNVECLQPSEQLVYEDDYNRHTIMVTESKQRSELTNLVCPVVDYECFRKCGGETLVRTCLLLGITEEGYFAGAENISPVVPVGGNLFSPLVFELELEGDRHTMLISPQYHPR